MLHYNVIFYTAMIIGEYSEKEPVVYYGYYMDTEQTSNCIVLCFCDHTIVAGYAAKAGCPIGRNFL